MTEWRPLRSGDVWVKRDDDETAVYDTEAGRLHFLNATALALWDACDGMATVGELVDAVVELTGLEHERADVEVRGALEELKVAGLVS